jgi:hypothetical protein
MNSKKYWLTFGGLAFFLAGCSGSLPSVLTPADEITVDFGKKSGSPTYRASGFIYGLAEDGNLPAANLQSEIKVKFIRAGGAQLGCPNGGFVNGDYARRWESVKGYYARAKELGAPFILMPHDLWGADAVCPVPRWPGDNGDWSEFTSFLAQVIADVKSNGMAGPNVQWDIWNEPDLQVPVQFWGRGQEQYLEMWKRAYSQIREAIPDAVIVGPSSAGQPFEEWIWFTTYLDYVKANQVIPDYLSWHQLIPESDPQTSKDNLDTMLTVRGMKVKGYQVNEYGSNTTEQQAGPSIWYLAKFERNDIDALRANWGMGGGLYQGMGDLLTSADQPTSCWWAYQRYARMSGNQVAVNPGKQIDGLASIDPEKQQAIILLGSRAGFSGQVEVKLKNLASNDFPEGKIQIKIEQLPDGSLPLAAPLIVSEASAKFSENLTIPLNWNSAFDGYVITISG